MKNLDKFLKKFAGTSIAALKKGAIKKGSELKKGAMEMKGEAEEYLGNLGKELGESAGKIKSDALKYTKKNPEMALRRAASAGAATGATVGIAMNSKKKKERPY